MLASEPGDHIATIKFVDGIYIKKLKPGKSDGYDGLSSDYYCNGTPLL